MSADKNKAIKVALIHPNPTWYRIPLFLKLKNENIDIILTDAGSLPTYGIKDSKIIEKYLNNFISFKSLIVSLNGITFKITPALLKHIMKYNVIIWGDFITSLSALIFIPIWKLKKIKIIYWLDIWDYHMPLLRKLIDPIITRIIKMGDLYLAHGKKHLQYLLKLGINKERIILCRNASVIKTSNEDYERAKEIRNQYRYDYIALFVGGFIKRKNVDILIRAIKILSDKGINLGAIIIGDGPERKNLEKLVKDLKIENRIIFKGWINYYELAPYYIACDLFVFPSVNEPWGLVINEALQFNKPVITTNSVGASELIIDKKNGIILSKITPDDLAEAILYTINNLNKLKMNSAELMKEYSYENMAKNFLKAIKILYNN